MKIFNKIIVAEILVINLNEAKKWISSKDLVINQSLLFKKLFPTGPDKV